MVFGIVLPTNRSDISSINHHKTIPPSVFMSVKVLDLCTSHGEDQEQWMEEEILYQFVAIGCYRL